MCQDPEEVLFRHGEGHLRWDEAWQKEKEFHQKLHLKKYIYVQWKFLGTCIPCEDYYSQEKHIEWNGTQVCDDYTDVSWGSKHTQIF